MVQFLSGYKRKAGDNEACSSKDNEANSSREMVVKIPKCRKYDTKYLSDSQTLMLV
jgi:hypothetical protein